MSRSEKMKEKWQNPTWVAMNISKEKKGRLEDVLTGGQYSR
jgi:hypothetical protein